MTSEGRHRAIHTPPPPTLADPLDSLPGLVQMLQKKIRQDAELLHAQQVLIEQVSAQGKALLALREHVHTVDQVLRQITSSTSATTPDTHIRKVRAKLDKDVQDKIASLHKELDRSLKLFRQQVVDIQKLESQSPPAIKDLYIGRGLLRKVVPNSGAIRNNLAVELRRTKLDVLKSTLAEAKGEFLAKRKEEVTTLLASLPREQAEMASAIIIKDDAYFERKYEALPHDVGLQRQQQKEKKQHAEASSSASTTTQRDKPRSKTSKPIKRLNGARPQSRGGQKARPSPHMRSKSPQPRNKVAKPAGQRLRLKPAGARRGTSAKRKWTPKH